MNNITEKEYCELRIKLLEPLISTASKAGIDKADPVITTAADNLWGWVVKGLETQAEKNPSEKKASPSKKS